MRKNKNLLTRLADNAHKALSAFVGGEIFSVDDGISAFAALLQGFTRIPRLRVDTAPGKRRRLENPIEYIVRVVGYAENMAHASGGLMYDVAYPILTGFAGYVEVLTGNARSPFRFTENPDGSVGRTRVRVSEYIATWLPFAELNNAMRKLPPIEINLGDGRVLRLAFPKGPLQ